MASLTGKTIGPYRLLELIGHGGMAAVFKAYDLKADREVALKILAPSLAQDPRFTKRFVREAKVVLQIKHPNIVPVWDFGLQDEYFYFVMPYLKLGTLADRLQRTPLSPQETSRIMAQVCSALDAAHRNGVVHRDIKPSNILLDENGNALLTDFGVAQTSDSTVSLTGSALLGTPAYVSPEQARGDPTDARSDQYSLGIILFLIATGQLPFEADTPIGIAIKHVQEPLPLPRSVNPRVPPALERVILKATAKDPADRFETIAEFNAAFQAALAHALDPSQPAPQVIVPPSAQATSPFGRVAPSAPTRRSRAPLWIAAVVLLLLVPAMALAAPGIIDIVRPAPTTLTEVQYVTPPGLQATIDALSTNLALPADGVEMSGEQVATAVAGTLVAQGALPGGGLGGLGSPLGEMTETPTPIGATAGPSRTATRTPHGGGGGGLPVSSPFTRTPSPTPTEFSAPTQPVTNTPLPSPTPTPPATDTPVPPPSDTPVPPPTDTPIPPATNTPVYPCQNPHSPVTCTPRP